MIAYRMYMYLNWLVASQYASFHLVDSKGGFFLIGVIKHRLQVLAFFPIKYAGLHITTFDIEDIIELSEWHLTWHIHPHTRGGLGLAESNLTVKNTSTVYFHVQISHDYVYIYIYTPHTILWIYGNNELEIEKALYMELRTWSVKVVNFPLKNWHPPPPPHHPHHPPPLGSKIRTRERRIYIPSVPIYYVGNPPSI